MHFTILAILILLALPSSGALNKPPKAPKLKISWMFTAFEDVTPEYRRRFMTEDNEIFKALVRDLPDYDHEYTNANVSRIEKELKEKNLVCYPASTNYDRRSSFTYLTQLGVVPAPVLITRKEIAQKYKDKDGKIALHDLVVNPNLRGIFAESRSYGTKIDNVLWSKDSKVRARPMATLGANPILKITDNQADFTLEYRGILEAIKISFPLDGSVVTVPLKDFPASIPSYIACSKTADGKVLIEKLDQIIRRRVGEDYYRKTLLEAATAIELPLFSKEVNEFIIDRQKASLK